MPKRMSSSSLLAYRAKHFKCFVDTGWIDVKPLSLLFGHNSSGKSALLSVLPMLRQTIEDPNPDVPFVFSSETGIDLGTYEEVAHDHVVKLDTPIWFSFKVEPSRRFLFLRRGKSIGVKRGDLFMVEVAVNYNKKRRRIAITNFCLSVFDTQQANERREILRLYRKTTAENQKWHIEADESISKDLRGVSPSWTHFFPQIMTLHRGRITEAGLALRDVLQSVYYSMREALRVVVHLGPSRAFPRRAYRITGESPRDVGIMGENWPNILMKSRERQDLLRNVNFWLRRLGYELTIEWGRQGYIHPTLKDGKTGLEVSLKDVGFGISQVLPILVQGFASSPGTILILEQPEIHLHPRAQADLGDMLMAIAQRGVHLLVETHSEHLLLRVQRRLAEAVLGEGDERMLASDQVAVYYVEKAGSESFVHRIQMDETGTFMGPPERFATFFSDDYEETIERAKILARLKREKKDARRG